MAECRQMTDMISRYIDGELNEPEKRELERHLEQCPSCRSVLSAYENIAAAAAQSLEEPPADFAENVMAAVKRLPKDNIVRVPDKNRRKTVRNTVITFAAAAACVALALVVAPQLARTGSSKNATMSASMAPAEAPAPAVDSEMTLESAPEDGTLGGTADSYSMAGGAAVDEDSAGTAQTEQVPMVCASSEPDTGQNGASPTPAPEQTTGMRTDPELLKRYAAVLYINGQLPGFLTGMDSAKSDDGTVRIEISADTADTMLSDGYAGIQGNPDANTALVVYTPSDTDD